MMETTVVNIMDIERYQFSGVIGNDEESIPGQIIFSWVGKYLDLLVSLNFLSHVIVYFIRLMRILHLQH